MSRVARVAVAVAVAVVCAALVPRLTMGRDGDAWFDGDVAVQTRLADGVAARVSEHSGGVVYHSGMSRFDGQSAVAIHQMTLLGLGQVVIAHPELRDRYLPAMRRAAEELARPETLAYAAERYGEHGVVAMDPGEGHAYLGYVNLGLGMLRRIEPDASIAAVHDRITEGLWQRLRNAPNGLIETYPDETWPPDVAAVAGSIGLHATATGVDRSAELDAWATRFAACAIDESGFLVQRTHTGTCDPADGPRGSGTAVGAYFISFAHPRLAERLYRALTKVGRRSLIGFAAMREYAPGHSGAGDVNAGPILFGMSVGATGFGLGAARAHGDRETFVAMFRTTDLFGVPVEVGGQQRFAMGGLLGDALLLAMLTALPPERMR